MSSIEQQVPEVVQDDVDEPSTDTASSSGPSLEIDVSLPSSHLAWVSE